MEASVYQRGSRVIQVRSKRKETVTHLSNKGWVVVGDRAWDFSDDDERLDSSAASDGTPADGGWVLDRETP